MRAALWGHEHVDDDELMTQVSRMLRSAAPPSALARFNALAFQFDVRAALPLISCPTLVIHRRRDRWVRVDHSRFLADQIAGARFVEFDDDDAHAVIVGDTSRLAEEVEQFLTGRRTVHDDSRVLATVMVSDIVGSTRLAAELGDRRWSELLGDHHAAIRQQLERYRGREVDTAGDGFLAVFDGPGRAISCAQAMSQAVAPMGLELRVGLHTGEVQAAGTGIRGLAVHIASRVAALAHPGQILVSQTVKDLVVGSGIELHPTGRYTLKGVPDEWEVYQVVSRAT
jgi:class 3 adenylate cyclase